MEVWILWHGGASYAAPEVSDAERFPSLQAATVAFESRADASNRYYPCVDRVPEEDGGPTAHVFIGERPEGDAYPDYVISYGPRGGLRVERV